MRRHLLAAASAAAAACLSLVALAPSAGASPSPQGFSHRNTDVCSTPAPGHAACLARRHDTVNSAGVVVNPNTLTPNAGAAPNVTGAPPSGFGPSDIWSAYKLPGLSATTSGTVAIVDAYHYPQAADDLTVYRQTYGLPACTGSCFRQVDQSGGSNYPAVDAGWAQEIALDIDMVSAACPRCSILLVEANSSSLTDLAAAVRWAALQQEVVAISNSYGASDLSATTYSSVASAYNVQGKAVTASSGDSGYGVQSPASFPGVVAVGGTSLSRAGNSRGWTESAWSGAGSGCSRYNAKPKYQSAATKCTRKADADVSAVADPNTGVAVYDSLPYGASAGWQVFGGTSAASPIIASLYAQGPTYTGYAGAYTWGKAASLFDVTTGANGRCTTRIWCQTATGWDGPTGLGTPNGVNAF